MTSHQPIDLNPELEIKLTSTGDKDSLFKMVLHCGKKFNKDLKIALALLVNSSEEIRDKLRS